MECERLPETGAAEPRDALHRHDGALDEHEEHLLQCQRQALLVVVGRAHLEPRHDELRGASHAVLEVGFGREPPLEGPLAAPQPRLQHRQQEVIGAVHAEFDELWVAPATLATL